MSTDFDDSQWERIEGKDLGVRRSGGHNAFMWFRGLLTMPARIGDFDQSKPAGQCSTSWSTIMRKSGSTDKCRAGAAIPARLPFRASTCPIAWYLVPKSRPATDSSSQCLRLTDQCPIRSEAFGFARPWWSFIVDEQEAGQIAGIDEKVPGIDRGLKPGTRSLDSEQFSLPQGPAGAFGAS